MKIEQVIAILNSKKKRFKKVWVLSRTFFLVSENCYTEAMIVYYAIYVYIFELYFVMKCVGICILQYVFTVKPILMYNVL